jgi:hypothetical protein
VITRLRLGVSIQKRLGVVVVSTHNSRTASWHHVFIEVLQVGESGEGQQLGTLAGLGLELLNNMLGGPLGLLQLTSQGRVNLLQIIFNLFGCLPG